MGYLRFILAFFVLISHLEIRFRGLNPGVTAVVIFYLLAGHVVSHLWMDLIPPGKGRLMAFYKDRALRIMPLYLYVMVLTLLFLFVTDYGSPNYSLLKLMGNLLVVPLNYYMLIDTTILTDPSWWLIPPAWSLGVELQAYLLLPLIFEHRWLKRLLTLGSMGVYMAANLNYLNPDYFGYRLIPGVFFIFVAGASIQRRERLFPWAVWGMTALIALIFWRYGWLNTYATETFLGILLGVPLLSFLSRFRPKPPLNALLGSLSYGIFLSHFLVVWWFDYLELSFPDGTFYAGSVALVSILISFTGVYCLEKRVDAIRKEKKT